MPMRLQSKTEDRKCFQYISMWVSGRRPRQQIWISLQKESQRIDQIRNRKYSTVASILTAMKTCYTDGKKDETIQDFERHW